MYSLGCGSGCGGSRGCGCCSGGSGGGGGGGDGDSELLSTNSDFDDLLKNYIHKEEEEEEIEKNYIDLETIIDSFNGDTE